MQKFTVLVVVIAALVFVFGVKNVGSHEKCESLCERGGALGVSDVLRFGKGAVFADFNGDGYDDILALDSAFSGNRSANAARLYRNDGGKVFSSIDPRTVGITVSDLQGSWGVSVADYDRDGDEDILLASGGYAIKNHLSLYRNDFSGGALSFTRVNDIAGIPETVGFWWGVSWSDIDRDGWADFVAIDRTGPIRIFHNDHGSFTDVSATLGIDGVYLSDGKGPVWLDYDSDGYQDLFVPDRTGRGHFFHNLRGTHFIDVTKNVVPSEPLVLYNPVFSASAADFDQDGRIDLYLGSYTSKDVLLINKGGTFEPHGEDIGIRKSLSSDPLENTMGLGVGDIDQNGYPDVLLGTGTPTEEALDLVFCGFASGNVGVSFSRCGDFTHTHGRTQTHGIIVGDINNDGSPDIFYNLGGSSYYDADHAGVDTRHLSALYSVARTDRHSATLKLKGTVSNPDAYGARITVEGSPKKYYFVLSTQGFQSQNSAWTILDLGTSTKASIVVQWPSGKETRAELMSGERQTITE